MESPQKFLPCQVVDWYAPGLDRSSPLSASADTDGSEAESLQQQCGTEITGSEGGAR